MTQAGRNDPCPCGSGKKHKHCCLRQDAAQRAAAPGTPPANLLRDAMAHHQAGRLSEASALYQRILEAEPRNADAWHLSGLVAQQVGQLDGAAELIRTAIRLQPAAAMHYHLGLVLQSQGNLPAAAAAYREAIALRPTDARAHGNLGTVLQNLGELEAAVSAYRQALALNPDDASAAGNLGVALEQRGDIDGALQRYRRALALQPDNALTLNNLGNALRDQEQLEAAADCLRKAIALQPDYAIAHRNLGNVLQDQGRLDDAIACFQRALALQPDDVEAHWNESLALLMQGRLEAGWVEHEWRLRKPDHRAGYRGLLETGLLYAGEDLTGRTLLVWAEQGVGDELFFAGVLPDAIRAAAHCVVECDPRLVSLYARSFPGAEVIAKATPPDGRTRQADIDWHCPVGSLPRWFRPTLDRFPRHDGYLVPDPQRVAFWAARLAALGPQPKVGIGWRSSRRSAGRDLHYTRLDQWGAILAVPGVTFINLQYDECRTELDAAREQFGVEIHDWTDLDQKNDLDDVVALMSALDLVIGPTTTPQIMAGAAGVPTWMLLTEHITWKTLGTDGFPMLPSVRPLWRARQVAWHTVLEETALKLRDWSAQRP